MVSLSEAFEKYRTDFIVMKNQSLKTEEAYQNTSHLLSRYFRDKPIDKLTFEDVRDWRLWLLTWQKPDTARGNTICLRMVLKFFAENGHDVLRYERIIVPKREKRKVKYLTEQEIDEFIYETAKKQRGYHEINRLRNIAIIEVLFATGLRNGELCGLDRDTIRNRQFTIVGKSKDPRVVFVNDRAEKAIKTYLNARSDNNKALFISFQTEKRITSGTLQRVFARICANSDFADVTPHTIRHSYATYLLEKEVDLIYVGDLLGHADLNTTKMYTHYANPKLRKVYEKAWNSKSMLT